MRIYLLAVAQVLIMVVAAVAPMEAWQWPVPVPAISRTFGQDAGGYLMRGMEFAAGAQPVYPVEAGVVVAAHEATDAGLPSGLGSYVVIEHDQGFRSIYAHLEAEFLPGIGQRVSAETQIGVVGESGLVAGRALRLYIIDLESGEYVNPVLLLPDLEDAVSPSIRAVYARSADALYDLRQTRSLPAGDYEITATIEDGVRRTGDPEPLAPYSVRVFVGGQESFHVVMDRILAGPEGTRLEPGGAAAESLYGVDGLYRLGRVTVGAGETQLEVVVNDFAGNETSRSLVLRARTAGDEGGGVDAGGSGQP